MVDFTEMSQEGTGGPPTTPPKRKPKASSVVPAPKKPEVLPAIKDPLDIVPYRAEIMAFQNFVVKVDHEVRTISIEGDEQKVYAAALGGEIAKTLKAIEARRKEILKDPQDFERQINGICKMITEPLKRSDDLLRWKEKQYNLFLENQRNEAERKQRELARAIETKIKEDALMRGVSQAEVDQISVPVMIPKEETVTRADTGASSYVVKTWKCEIVNEAEIPREYCSPDSKKLNQAVKNDGVREIPGCKIFEDSDVRRRTA